MKYHQYKIIMSDLAKLYISLPSKLKKYYLQKNFPEDNFHQLMIMIDSAMDVFKVNIEIPNNYLLSDIFQAIHTENGRNLIRDVLTLIKIEKIDFFLRSGEYIQVAFEPTSKAEKNEISAEFIGDNKQLSQINPTMFIDELNKHFKPGNPKKIKNISLQYTNQYSVSFGDTINHDGNHEFYLIETYVTFLHELGHIKALLCGEYYSPHNPNKAELPNELTYFHEIEEYLNIVVRELSENNMDPLKIIRISHCGIELANLDKLTLDKIFDIPLLLESIHRNKVRIVNDFKKTHAISYSIKNDLK